MIATIIISNPTEGLLAIQNWLLDRHEETPEDVRDKLRLLLDPTQQRSPVEAACNAAELIYARREECPPELLEIGAQLASMANDFKLFGLGIDGRGYAISYTIRAMANVVTNPPLATAFEAPEPAAEFAPAAEPGPDMPVPPEGEAP